MFDKYSLSATKEYMPYEKNVTIHEHRAPTDDSIKIFNELKEKAHRSLVQEVVLKDNIINGKINVHLDGYRGQYVCYCKVVINGRDLVCKFDIDNMLEKHDLISIVYERVAKEIAKEMISKDRELRRI